MSDIIRKLQQRIDRRSNNITVMERYLKEPDLAWAADEIERYREDQALDKRLMGELVESERQRARLQRLLFKSLFEEN